MSVLFFFFLLKQNWIAQVICQIMSLSVCCLSVCLPVCSSFLQSLAKGKPAIWVCSILAPKSVSSPSLAAPKCDWGFFECLLPWTVRKSTLHTLQITEHYYSNFCQLLIVHSSWRTDWRRLLSFSAGWSAVSLAASLLPLQQLTSITCASQFD